MKVLELNTGQEVKRVLGIIHPGETEVHVDDVPVEVRLFSPDHPEGLAVSDWDYDSSEGKVIVPVPPNGNETIVVFSDGVPIFTNLFMLSDGTISTIESGIIIFDTEKNLENITVDIGGYNYSGGIVKWKDEDGEHDFPFTKDFLPRGQTLAIELVAHLSSETFGNYRDIWIVVSATRSGDNE